jgi:hypothetical protein
MMNCLTVQDFRDGKHLEQSRNPTNEVSRTLGIERLQLRRALHRIKRAQGLKGADRITNWNDGSVTDQRDNVLGNIYDEIS